MNEDGREKRDDQGLIEDEAASTKDEFQSRLDQMTFVVATKKLQRLRQWAKVSEVFKSDSDRPFLKRTAITES